MSPIDAHDDYNKGRLPRWLSGLLLIHAKDWLTRTAILSRGRRCVEGAGVQGLTHINEGGSKATPASRWVVIPNAPSFP
jgi:hypothetical protein